MKTKLDLLFKSYKQAFDQFDANAIASFYQFPCLISDVDGQHAYNYINTLTSKFFNNCIKMQDLGYAGSKFSLGKIVRFGDNIISVDINWQVQLETGPYDFGTLYLCSFEDDNLLIFSAVVYDV